MKTSSIRYNAIDLIKFFMALCVVAIHTQPLCTVSNPYILEIESAIVRMAVPFFFTASGFLLAAKMKEPYDSDTTQTILKKYIFRILKLYLIWTLIYLPWTIYTYILYGTPLKEAILDFLRGFFLLGEHSITWMMWYLLSTIYAVILIRFLLKRKMPLKYIVWIGFGILLAGLCIDKLMSMEEPLPGLLVFAQKVIAHTISYGRLFPSVFYISLGLLLRSRPLSIRTNWALFLVGFAGNCILRGNTISNLLLIPSVTGLFGLVASWNLKDLPVYPFLRKSSTVIYLLHMYIFTIYNKVTRNVDVFGMDCFLVSVLGCMIAATLYLATRSLLKRIRSQASR